MRSRLRSTSTPPRRVEIRKAKELEALRSEPRFKAVLTGKGELGKRS